MIIKTLKHIKINDYKDIETYKIQIYIHALIYITSCPGAPVAPRYAASCHADQHYVQSRNMKYSTSRDH